MGSYLHFPRRCTTDNGWLPDLKHSPYFLYKEPDRISWGILLRKNQVRWEIFFLIYGNFKSLFFQKCFPTLCNSCTGWIVTKDLQQDSLCFFRWDWQNVFVILYQCDRFICALMCPAFVNIISQDRKIFFCWNKLCFCLFMQANCSLGCKDPGNCLINLFSERIPFL